MKRIKPILVSVTFFVLSINLAAQKLPISFPSPEAAELGKYGQVPVSYFNGLPEISIPLYTLKCKDIEVPISLSYHAAGNKPDEHPSWVGLGWNLDAGGMITRIIHGKRDELRKEDYSQEVSINEISYTPTHDIGYYYRAADMNTPQWADSTFLTQVINESFFMDTEPDEFIYNFNGHSGSFYFVSNNGQMKVKVKSKSGDILKVEVQFSDNGGLPSFSLFDTYVGGETYNVNALKTFQKFIITTVDGNKYEFGGSNDNIDFTTSSKLFTTASSWHLSKIISPTGNYIDFEYERKGTLFVPSKALYKYESNYHDSNNSTNCIETDNYNNSDGRDGFSMVLVNPKYLRSITTSSQQEIYFTSSPSTELNYNWNSFDIYSKDLLSILNMTDYPAMKARDYINNYAYVKLDHIEIGGGKNIKFAYTNDQNQRLKLLGIAESPLTDPNGASGNLNDPQNILKYTFRYNTTPLPAYLSRKTDNWGFYNNKDYSLSDFSSLYNYRSANFTYAKAEILERITYPTGGATTFEYELHQYSKIMSGLALNAPFTLSSSSGAAGGLRIKTITNYPDTTDTSKKVQKQYYYENENGSQSGILSGIPTYTASGSESKLYRWKGWLGLVNYQASANYTYNQYSQNLLLPLSTTNGQHVTYSRVKEVDTNGGYTVYRYTNHENFPDEVPLALLTSFDNKALINSFTSKELERGLLKSVETYNKSNQIVHKTTYAYNDSPDRYNDYVKTIDKYFLDPGKCDCYFLRLSANKIYTFYPYLKTKTETNYYYNSRTDSVTKTTKYNYNAYNLPSCVTETGSKSAADSMMLFTKYPFDISATIYNAMSKKMMLNYPVETIKYRGTKITGGSLSTYKQVINGADTMYLPDKMYALEITTPSSLFTLYDGTTMDNRYGYPNLEFVNYGTHGNIYEIKDRKGTSISYLWSYNYQYPIAEIKNATISKVKNALNLSNIDSELSALSTPPMSNINQLRSTLDSALVSTYTYLPYIGLETATDPRGVTTNYTYDTFNRLYLARNDDKNIVARYRYAYQNNPDNGMGGYSFTAEMVTDFIHYHTGSTIHATINASGGSNDLSYNWSLLSGSTVLSTSNSNNFSYACFQNGALTLQCIVTDNNTGQQITLTKALTCYQELSAVVSTNASSYVIHDSGSATVSVSGGSGSYTYNWYLLLGSTIDKTGSNSAFYFSFTTSGTYTLKCVVTDSVTGETVTRTQVIGVEAPTIIQFSNTQSGMEGGAYVTTSNISYSIADSNTTPVTFDVSYSFHGGAYGRVTINGVRYSFEGECIETISNISVSMDTEIILELYNPQYGEGASSLTLTISGVDAGHSIGANNSIGGSPQ